MGLRIRSVDSLVRTRGVTLCFASLRARLVADAAFGAEKAGQFGLPIDRNEWSEDTLVPFALDVAKALVRKRRYQVTSDGVILVEKSDGGCVALHCARTEGAWALQLGPMTCAILGDSLLRSVFALLSSFWTDSELSPLGRNSPADDALLGVRPEGFETLLWSRQAGFEGARAPDSMPSQAWRDLLQKTSTAAASAAVEARVSAMTEGQRSKFERSFLAAVRFLWLHELGHILSGHLTLGGVGGIWSELGEPALVLGVDAPPGLADWKPSFASYAKEMEADAWANNMLFSQPATRPDLVVDLIGVLSVFIFFHGRAFIERRTERPNTHPPVWFRATQTIAAMRSPGASVHAAIHDVLNVTNHHPIFSELLEPLTRDDWRAPAQALIARTGESTPNTRKQLSTRRTYLV